MEERSILNIKMDLIRSRWARVDWIDLSEVKVKFQVLLYQGVNNRFKKKAGQSLTYRSKIIFEN
jgi:hypothetical protein